MREVLLAQTISTLREKGFSISTYFHLNNCFDLAAKKGQRIFFIKVLANIDAMRAEQASELKRIGAGFNASVFVVGEKTKTFELKERVVYERYGVNCICLQTLTPIIENDAPEVKYFKGKEIVELDMKKLREKRLELGFTLSDIAKKINTTPESMHRYETKGNASLQAALRLEEVFGKGIVKKIDMLSEPVADEPKEPKNIDSAFERIEKLGLKLEFFSHAPFKAYSHPSEAIYFSQAKRKDEIKKKAKELSMTKKIVGGIPMLIAKESEKKSIDNVPVIEEEELYSLSKKSGLLELADERQKHGKHKKS